MMNNKTMTFDEKWNHFLRMTASIYVKEERKILMDKKLKANVFICFDDFVTVI